MGLKTVHPEDANGRKAKKRLQSKTRQGSGPSAVYSTRRVPQAGWRNKEAQKRPCAKPPVRKRVQGQVPCRLQMLPTTQQLGVVVVVVVVGGGFPCC